jgi:ATP-binding cassette subfamily B protein
MDSTRIETAAAAQEVVDRLPQGYDTLLGKWFVDGTDLSVGEWKRICLARTFFRQAPIIILNEPTAGMDSWAEAEWMDRFTRMAQEKTAVLITHRFTTAMRADFVFVMQQGQIVESGSHQQLLSKKGEYARSWNQQGREPPIV